MTSRSMAGISRRTHDSHPFRRQLRTPAGRTVALAAWTTATAAVVAGIAGGSKPLIAAGIVGWVPAMAAVNLVGGAPTVVRTSEREVRDRERARLAHRGLGVVLILAVAVAGALAGTTVGAETLVAVLAAVALVHLAGPSLLLAARARLDEADDA